MRLSVVPDGARSSAFRSPRCVDWFKSAYCYHIELSALLIFKFVLATAKHCRVINTHSTQLQRLNGNLRTCRPSEQHTHKFKLMALHGSLDGHYIVLIDGITRRYLKRCVHKTAHKRHTHVPRSHLIRMCMFRLCYMYEWTYSHLRCSVCGRAVVFDRVCGVS